MSFDQKVEYKSADKVGAHVLAAVDHQRSAKYGNAAVTPLVHEQDGSVSYTATQSDTGVKSKHTFSKGD